VPIPGTTKLHRLEENLGAANVGLTGDDLAEIERAASAIKVQGARYHPPNGSKQLPAAERKRAPKADSEGRLLLADCVAKVENRTTLKISRKVDLWTFLLLRRFFSAT